MRSEVEATLYEAVTAAPPPVITLPTGTVKIGKLKLHIASDGTRVTVWDKKSVSLSIAMFIVVWHLAANSGITISNRKLHDHMKHSGVLRREESPSWRTNIRSTIKRIKGKFKEIDPAFQE